MLIPPFVCRKSDATVRPQGILVVDGIPPKPRGPPSKYEADDIGEPNPLPTDHFLAGHRPRFPVQSIRLLPYSELQPTMTSSREYAWPTQIDPNQRLSAS